MRLPIPYLPPGARTLARGASAGGILKSLFENTGGRVPLISVNPAGPLSYAWAIADAAVLEEERGKIERGVMNEPIGAGVRSLFAFWLCVMSARRRGCRLGAHEDGVRCFVEGTWLTWQPEWYTTRLALSLAYLSAESVLLRPYPQLPPNQIWAPGQPNPHLPLAQQTLQRNMSIYDTFRSGVTKTEKGAGGVMGYVEFLGKSLGGIVKSRYW